MIKNKDGAVLIEGDAQTLLEDFRQIVISLREVLSEQIMDKTVDKILCALVADGLWKREDMSMSLSCMAEIVDALEQMETKEGANNGRKNNYDEDRVLQ